MPHLLNPEAMRSGWRTPTPPFAVLDARGEYLANALFQLKNLDKMRYRRVIEHTRLVEPAMDAINFIAPAPDQGAMPFVALQGRPAASWAGLSDGTLRFLAIAYLTEVSNFWAGTAHQTPRLTIIEEPENGIYPGQLRAMFDLFDERAPQGQFIFTSHSPYFIDLFDATRDAVTILKRNEDRTEIVSAPSVAPEEQSPERLTLAEKYAAELIG